MLTPITKIALPSRFVVFHFQFLYKCKADIRNSLSLLAHERSRFATCQWELLTPTDISIPFTHRLVLYALEAGECLFCVQYSIFPLLRFVCHYIMYNV